MKKIKLSLIIAILLFSFHLHYSYSDLCARQQEVLQDEPVLYRAHIAAGDKYLSDKNYARAMIEYEKASEILPYEDEPRLKMQSIEATLGINELEEVRRKIEQAKMQDMKSHGLIPEYQPVQQSSSGDFNSFLKERSDQSKRDSLRKVIFDRYASELQSSERIPIWQSVRRFTGRSQMRSKMQVMMNLL
jgi:hypothetical protein